MIDDATLAASEAIRQRADLTASLSAEFFPTAPFRDFQARVFGVLEEREARLKAGLTEQKGAALIGPAGTGKSRMADTVIMNYEAVAEATGGREFGSKIVSTIVPGRASIKDTLREILRQMGYPCEANRDEDYLTQRVLAQFEGQRVAALHLDEVQDSGRYATSDSMRMFSKKFRNLMQHRRWPVCLILTATLEGREFINHDQTLTRRLRPIEILPMSHPQDAQLLRSSAATLVHRAGLADGGLFDVPEFLEILMHASAYRFGIAMEMTIEAIDEAMSGGDHEIGLDHFAGAYYLRMNCDDEINPFISPYWKAIDTTTAMDRNLEQRKEELRKEAEKRKKRKVMVAR
jgi:hypothetical protein